MVSRISSTEDRSKRSSRKKKRRYTVTDAVIERNNKARTHAIHVRSRVVNQLGMFRVPDHESVNSIDKSLSDCAKTSNHIIIPYCLLRAFDEDLYKAAVMSFLLYMEAKLTDEKYKWFVVKYPEVERFTGAKRKRIVQIMKDFREAGVIKTKRRGIPAMPHYNIDHDMLIQLCMERVLNYKDPMLEFGIACVY